MTTLLILAAVFGGTLLLVVATYQFVNRDKLATREIVQQRLASNAPGSVGPALSILKEERASSFEFLNRLLEGRSFTAGLALSLERAGSKMSVGTFLLLDAVTTAFGWLIGQRAGTLGAIAFAAIGAMLPFLNLKRLQRKRTKKLESQLPEAIDMLVNAMKAGYSLQAAMKFIGEEVSDPLGPEFTRFYDEQRLGVDVRLALNNLAARSDTLDLKMFVTALLIQRESGGNLAEVMTNLSTVMRERVALRGELDTLTAEPKMSAVVLTLLPISLFALINVMNRNYIQPLYDTDTGHHLLIYGAVSIIIGYLILRRMSNVDM
jgi:tight adherence protein B